MKIVLKYTSICSKYASPLEFTGHPSSNYFGHGVYYNPNNRRVVNTSPQIPSRPTNSKGFK